MQQTEFQEKQIYFPECIQQVTGYIIEHTDVFLKLKLMPQSNALHSYIVQIEFFCVR